MIKSVFFFIIEIREALKLNAIWYTMARQEIVSKYRRTTMGPWWITLGTGIGIAAMGFVWSTVFNVNIDELLPYLSCGFIIWTMISTTLIESSDIFIRAGHTLKCIKVPILIFVFSTVLKNLYIMAHNAIIFIIVIFIYKIKISTTILLVIPGTILFTITAILVSVVLSILGSRLRDLSYIISSLVTFIFLLTPIMWNPDMLTGNRVYLAYLNPITHIIAIIRDPLLNKVPMTLSYIFVSGTIIVLLILSCYLYKKFSKKIVFWV